MIKLLCLFLLLMLPVAAFAQDEPRKLLRGRVVADSLKVQNISVLNVSSKIGAVTDNDGEFTIYARPTDTLFFSSITFRSVKMPLAVKDFELPVLTIKLDVNVTLLDEVVITANPLTGDLEKDSKKTKALLISSTFQSGGLISTDLPRPQAPINTAMPQTMSPLTGVDFIKIKNMIFKKKKKDENPVRKYLQGNSFADVVKGRFSHYFFTETLKIPHAEIGLFLNFCDKGAATAHLVAPENEFDLTNYLIEKSAEYLKTGTHKY